MKIYRNIAILASALALACACQPQEETVFALDSDTFEVGADGGTATVEISSPGSWIASANEPWITVSPANGTGSHTCQILVDSSLVLAGDGVATRQGVVTIQGENWDTREITVTQQNYGYTVSLDNTEISVPDYDDLAERYFDVTVKSNVDFAVSFADEDGTPVDADDAWISEVEDNPSLTLDKGARPRNVKLRFNWKINQYPSDRIAQVIFTPVDGSGNPITMDPANIASLDQLKVTQTSAAAKPDKPRAADSTALVAISRSLNVWSGGWDTSVQMERWTDVDLWEEGDTYNGERIPEDWIGRVRYARFFMFNTEDGLPYQVSWLDAAENLVFYSNENYSIRKDIELGDAVTQLPNLRRLTISAYGLDNNSFPDTFFTKDGTEGGEPTFPNLEYLELSSNNFRYIDERFNERNFPKLRAFMMRNNQMRIVYDLSNSTSSSPENFAETNGGLYLENTNPENAAMGGGFPVRFLLWENLDTLQLTLNYLEGSLPTDEQILNYFSEHAADLDYANHIWTSTDEVRDADGNVILSVADSLTTSTAATFDNLQVPKVLPRMMVLSVNLNRFSGTLSPSTHKWLFYHPNMDWWEPSTFIFTQEGTDSKGQSAKFTGIPVTMDYYYNIFTEKKFAD